MTHLSVNLNVAALLRNRREHPWPDVVELGRIALLSGATGLTVHPRPDQRHTRPSDVRNLRALIDTGFPDRELNVEGYPDARFLQLVQEVNADQVTLVPDAPNQVTSDHGWDFAGDYALLTETIAGLHAQGRRVSLFANADAGIMAEAAATGTDRVEFYTGPYGAAHSDPVAQRAELDKLAAASKAARAAGLGINAGHDLTVPGTVRLVKTIPEIDEVSIGHALFCDALTFGMADTVRRYVNACTGKLPSS